MHWIQCDNGDFQNYSSLELEISKYILVHSGTDWHILVYTSKNGKLHLIMRHPPSGAHDSAQNAWIGPSSQFSS